MKEQGRFGKNTHRKILLASPLIFLAVACSSGADRNVSAPEANPNLTSTNTSGATINPTEASTRIVLSPTVEVKPTEVPIVDPEQRLLDFFNSSVKPEYRLDKLSNLTTVINDTAKSKILQPENRAIVANGVTFFPADAVGTEDGTFKRDSIQVVVAEKATDMGIGNVEEIYGAYFVPHPGPSVWTARGGAYERKIAEEGNIIISEVVYYYQGAVIAAVCQSNAKLFGTCFS